ncbi:MAG: hypothetical protein A3F11_02120 [Gammaproteobacteria bacterium RIFCSPHIGHO2_12_FULL_37_14]|nr:MAG: hypothetical protein A3F11_02120 [Gammaproteobacteria bacterium RIFCSPHIGHO2_12_FULL_37_14]
MKQFPIIFLLILSILATSCSTNTQKENTAIGAVSGGVIGGLAGSLVGGGAGRVVAIGAGVVAGALLGGYIGHSMDSSDNTKMNHALNSNATNQTSSWKNKKTGAKYTMTPTSKMMTVNGNPNCRKFRSNAIIDGKKQQVHGIACRQADGSWQAINGKM